MEIGFVGVGRMGFHMVRRLIEAGHTLIVYDNSSDAVARVVKLGAKAAASPLEIANTVETVMASLPTPDIVLNVATGDGGVIGGSRIKRFVDLSTTGSQVAQRVAELLKARNIAQIDSPVSGGVAGAEKGALVEPVLAVIGKVFKLGERSGSAQTMKLLNNYLSATAMAATSEAMVMGVKAGLEPRAMLDVLNAGSGMNTASRDKFPRNIVTRTFDAGFATNLMLKDVKLCLAESNALGVPNDILSVVQRLWQVAENEIGGDKDFTTIVQPLERRAGVEVKERK